MNDAILIVSIASAMLTLGALGMAAWHAWRAERHSHRAGLRRTDQRKIGGR